MLSLPKFSTAHTPAFHRLLEVHCVAGMGNPRTWERILPSQRLLTPVSEAPAKKSVRSRQLLWRGAVDTSPSSPRASPFPALTLQQQAHPSALSEVWPLSGNVGIKQGTLPWGCKEKKNNTLLSAGMACRPMGEAEKV